MPKNKKNTPKQTTKSRIDRFSQAYWQELQKATFRGIASGHKVCCNTILKLMEDGDLTTMEDVKRWCESNVRDVNDVQKVILDEEQVEVEENVTEEE